MLNYLIFFIVNQNPTRGPSFFGVLQINNENSNEAFEGVYLWNTQENLPHVGARHCKFFLAKTPGGPNTTKNKGQNRPTETRKNYSSS